MFVIRGEKVRWIECIASELSCSVLWFCFTGATDKRSQQSLLLVVDRHVVLQHWGWGTEGVPVLVQYESGPWRGRSGQLLDDSIRGGGGANHIDKSYKPIYMYNIVIIKIRERCFPICDLRIMLYQCKNI